MIDTSSIAEVFWFGVGVCVCMVIVAVILDVAWQTLKEK